MKTLNIIPLKRNYFLSTLYFAVMNRLSTLYPVIPKVWITIVEIVDKMSTAGIKQETTGEICKQSLILLDLSGFFLYN